MPRACLVLLALAAALGACRGAAPTDELAAESVAVDVPEGATAYTPALDGPLRVLSATPAGPMAALAATQRVAVTFSQPMVPLGEAPPVDAGTLTLEPAVEGTLRWDGSQTLVFQPAVPLPMATAFTVHVQAGLEALGGDRLEEPVTWTFETPRPQVIELQPARGERFAKPEAPIRLRFNQAVRAGEAASFVSLRAGEDERRVEAAVEQDGDSTLVLRPDAPLAQGTAYAVVLAEGLPSAQGPLGTAEPVRLPFRTYPALGFEGVSQRYADNQQIAPQRGLTLSFTTPVRFEDVRQAVTFEPAVEWPAGVEARDGTVSAAQVLPVVLEPETRYTVTVRGLTDVFGQTLDAGRDAFRTRALAPALAMQTGLLVVEADEEAVVPLRATNVEAVRLGAERLGPEAIVERLRAYDRGRYYPTFDGEADEAPEPVDAARSVPVPGRRNRPAVVPLRLDSLLQGSTGVVGLRVVGPTMQGGQPDYRALVQVTRLGLTAKFSPHQNLVLVTDLATAAPVSGARVTIRDAYGAVRWRGMTDASGRARAPGWAALGMTPPTDWQEPTQYAFVETADDLAFTSNLHDEGLEPYRFDVDYAWQPAARTDAGSVFTDRGLYRAGETVHLKAILRARTDADWSALTDSVRILVESPRDEVVLDRRLAPSALGTLDWTWTPPADAAQGVYLARVGRTADTTFGAEQSYYDRGQVAQGTFRVDAFRRATFAVTARAAAPEYVAGDFFEGTLQGRYLFGAAMGGQEASYQLQRAPGSYDPPGYDGYRFGPVGQGGGLYTTLLRADTTLGPDGTLALRTPLPDNEAGAPTTLTWSGTVTDPARQQITDRARLTLHPGLFYVGLKPRTTFLDLSDDPELAVDVVTVAPGGKPVAAEVAVEVVRLQWNSVREVGADGRLRWHSERTEERVATRQVATDESRAQRLRLTIAQGGRYLIRATGTDVRGNRVRTETYFYATGQGYVAWERADDDRVDLVPERTRYAPGETARLMVQSPYEEATALVTVEREGLLSSRVVSLTGSAPQVEVPLTEEHLPNAFVSVILLSGRTAAPDATPDAGAPGFKVGYATLQVDPGVRHLQVEVTPAQTTYRPGDEVTVDVRLRTADGQGVPGEMAFSAADAGVLNLVGYALPDPFEAFYGPRPLRVSTSESRAHLVEQRSFGQKEEDLLGGGGGAGLEAVRTDFRPLVHWAPAVRTDARGHATLTFRLPESLTTFRLMATALTADHRFGQGQTDVTVTKPLVLQAALPRLARLDDRFEAGVLVTNATGAPGTATVRAEADGGLSLSGAAEQTVRLAEGETREVRFAWHAATADTARLRFDARLDNEQDAFATTLPVRRPTARVATATFASTDSVATEALRLPADRVRGLGGLRLQLASTALVGLDGAARYLFDYPYGCLEQRTSRIRPLLAADDVLEAFDLEALDGDREAAVRGWTTRLDGYWTGDGFALWEGSSRVDWYTSAYTVLALAEAEAAGFDAPQPLTRDAVEALARRVRTRSERPDYYSARAWADARALMLYALARHGRVLETELAALAERREALTVEGRSLLLRALVAADVPALADARTALVQDLARRVQVEGTSAYLSVPDADDLGWIFSSDTRATAFGLAALIEAAPTDDRRLVAERMVRYLMEARRAGHWASTQENAAVVDAFGAFYRAYEPEAPRFTAQVLLSGRAVLEAAFQGRSLEAARASVPTQSLPSAQTLPLRLQKDGAGRLYYALLLETYTAEPQAAAANGLRVERAVQRLDDRGEPMGEALRTGDGTVALEAGALVRVTLRLSSPTSRSYVVVDDALPAGLEALNTAFVTANRVAARTAGTGTDRWWGSFNHTEIRDDRVLLFADHLRPGEHTYTYVARATTPGTFVHPPAQAKLMYQPATFGRTATGTLQVDP